MEKLGTALILEADAKIASQLREILCDQFGQVVIAPNTPQAITSLRERQIQMAFVGAPPEGGSCFDLLKDFVRTSPMTYIVVIADGSEKEIHDKAEGYGILGHIPRVFSSGHVKTLVNKYKRITQGL